MSGTLYVVGTPIGNLGDVTRRGAETLAASDRVVAEDTRRTRALLTHLGISGKPLTALDANAGERAVEAVVQRLESGESVSFVTDAGMPAISDPGSALVRAAAERGIAVIAVPGPSAVTAAVAVSGLVDGPFLFLGFLPRSGEKRQRLVRRITRSREPVVLFEAPGRAEDTLKELALVMPDRQACVARELTKLHEEVRRGTLSVLAGGETNARGEFTMVIAGLEGEEPDEIDVDSLVLTLLGSGASPRTVAEEVSTLSGKPRREVYARVLTLRRRDDAD